MAGRTCAPTSATATSATWRSTSRSCRASGSRCARRTAPRSSTSWSTRRPSPTTCQWALFLRNHDELTLEMVTDEERDYMWSEYAADQRARINLGIRRRLAPLVDNSRGRHRAAQLPAAVACRARRSSTTATRSGWATTSTWAIATACARRCSGRPTATPASRRADAAALYSPVIIDPVYGYQAVNVEAQERIPGSLLHFDATHRQHAPRATRPSGAASLEFLHPENTPVLAYLRAARGRHGAVRGQPVALQPVRRAGPSRWATRVPVEMHRPGPLPADSARCPTCSPSAPTGSTGSS